MRDYLKFMLGVVSAMALGISFLWIMFGGIARYYGDKIPLDYGFINLGGDVFVIGLLMVAPSAVGVWFVSRSLEER